MEDPYNYYGIGWGYWPWTGGGGHGRGFGGRGWGRGRRGGGGMGWGAAASPADAGPVRAQDEASVRRRIQALKEELDTWRKRLSGQSRSGESGQQ